MDMMTGVRMTTSSPTIHEVHTFPVFMILIYTLVTALKSFISQKRHGLPDDLCNFMTSVRCPVQLYSRDLFEPQSL